MSMTANHIRADWLAGTDTQTVFSALDAAGHQARVVGGAVRNALLGEAVDDIDIATTATPSAVIEAAKARGLRTIPTGLAHGTVTVLSGSRVYEVTTLRTDVSTDGRHADVAFTSDWVTDAMRRDFTINALYCDRNGVVFDPLGGLADLHARHIRFIGAPRDRICEDYLRILRFFRFFAQYDNTALDVAGLQASVRERAGLGQLSGERIRQEFMKLLSAPGATRAVRAMADYGLLTQLLPCVPNLALCARLTAATEPMAAALRLAGLGVVTEEDAARLSRKWRLSNAERRTLVRFAATYMCKTDLADMASLKRFLYRHGAQAFDEWIRAVWARSDKPSCEAEFDAARRLPEQWTPPRFPLTGADVLALGVSPGPAIGDSLAKIEADWIAGDFMASRSVLLDRLRVFLAAQQP